MTAIRLDGKVAVITGATGGWGSGAAFALAARGASVVLNSRTHTKVDALAKRIRDQGGEAVGIAEDVVSLAGATRLIEKAVERFGRVDCLVNAAGVRKTDTQGSDATDIYGGALLSLDEPTWRLVIDTELNMIYACTKAAASQMVAQGDGGAIMTVLGNVLGQAGQSGHVAAKAAALSCVWSWSDELKPHGIMVNGLRGYVRSLLTDPAFESDAHDFASHRDRGTLPLDPIDAGEIVAWLASNDAVGITGTYLGLDGPRVTIWEPRLPDIAVFRDAGWSADDLASRVGPILRRRPERPNISDQLMDLFNPHDRERALRQRAENSRQKTAS
jgi:NAD(P)-dependent dehydrogenase (short-subunit alcohol dehydrogenase family)